MDPSFERYHRQMLLPGFGEDGQRRLQQATAAIVGARRPDQIVETAQASNWNLSEEDIEKIEQLLAERQAKVETK